MRSARRRTLATVWPLASSSSMPMGFAPASRTPCWLSSPVTAARSTVGRGGVADAASGAGCGRPACSAQNPKAPRSTVAGLVQVGASQGSGRPGRWQAWRGPCRGSGWRSCRGAASSGRALAFAAVSGGVLLLAQELYGGALGGVLVAPSAPAEAGARGGSADELVVGGVLLLVDGDEARAGAAAGQRRGPGTHDATTSAASGAPHAAQGSLPYAHSWQAVQCRRRASWASSRRRC